MKTVSNKEIKITGNKTLRRYTIKTDSNKYKSYKMNKQEFNDASYWNGNDWQNFLNTNDYYIIK